MRLVVDANILVAELIRVRGRKLIAHQSLELFMAEKAWEETTYELSELPTDNSRVLPIRGQA